MTEKQKNALISIYMDGRGYIKDLRDKIGDSLISEFISVVFIICGYTRSDKTWRISELGRGYVRELQLINE